MYWPPRGSPAPAPAPHLLGQDCADDARQSAHAIGCGQHAKFTFREGIAGAAGRQAEIAGQRQLQATTDAGSLVRDDDGFLDGFHFVVDAVHAHRAQPVLLANG
jgi:hypothetical protein